MKKFKKAMAFAVASAMTLSTLGSAFAAESTPVNSGDVLFKTGLVVGDGSGDLKPAEKLKKQDAVVMLVRMLGKEAEAKATTTPSTFADDDNDAVIEPYLAWAQAQKLVNGRSQEVFGYGDYITAQETVAMFLRALGYADTAWADVPALAEKLGLVAEGTDLKGEVERSVVFDVVVNALKTPVNGGTELLADKLGVRAKLDELGVTTPAVVAVAVKLDSAVALNSKVVEVKVKDALTTVAASDFTVKDASAKAVAVTKAELAAYDNDKKTVLLTLEADTVVGTLYTVTSGTVSVNFGGKAKDTDKPTVTKVESTKYNEVKITFSEPIVMQGAVITLAEKYGSKTELKVTNMKYDGNDAIKVTTEEQKASTLYSAVISEVVDLAGNKMDKDDNDTFVGTKKNTDDLKIGEAKANEYNKVVVEFNTDIDAATISKATFKVEEAYGSKAVIAVAKAEKASKDDSYLGTDASADKSVLLTLDGSMKASTLYKVTVSGDMLSATGKALTSTGSDKEKTFVGVAKPTSEVEFAATPVTVDSNTQITIAFKEKVDEALVEDIKNYAIAEAYGSKTVLEVKAAELQDGKKTVKLTVASMKNALYNLTVTGIKDIYGNVIKTSSDANKTTFVGATVAEKVKNIVGIERVNDTTIRVEFDRNVGANAEDVSLYTIDNGVGYPSKAKKAADSVTNYKAKVELTIPKTTEGSVYKLTVKGLLNSDGVNMASDDKLEKTFVGQGNSATKAEIQAVYPIDSQTLKIYFDRSVEDSTIKGAGRIWNNDVLVTGALGISKDGGDTVDVDLAANLDGNGGTTDNAVWKDATESNALIVRLRTEEFEKTDSSATGNTFKLVGNSATVKSSDSANIKLFSYNDTDVAKPELLYVTAENSKTLVAYFNEPVAVDATPDSVFVYNDVDGITQILNSGTPVAVSSAVKVSDTQWKFILDRELKTTGTNVPSNKAAFLYLASAADDITDKSTFFGLKPNSDKTFRSVEFGINDTAADSSKISSVYAAMTNKRTIEVYFPEAMNETDVKTVSNYTIVANTDGTVKAGSNTFVANVSDYDSATNKATLYLNADIGSLTQNGTGAAFTKYYLAIKTGVQNAATINNIEAKKTAIDFNSGVASGLVIEFAPSTVDVPKPGVKAATVSDDRFTLDIEMDSKVKFPNAADGSANSFTAGGTLTAAEFLDAFKVDAQFEGETAVGAVAAGDIASVTINNDDNKVSVVFNVKLAANTEGKVTTKGTTANRIQNRNNVAGDVADGTEAKFGVRPSLFADATSPVVLSATLYDGTTNLRKGDGVAAVANDYILVTFSEALTASTVDTTTTVAAINTADFTLMKGVTAAGDTALNAGTTATASVLNANTVKITIVAVNGADNSIANGVVATPAVTDDVLTVKADSVADSSSVTSGLAQTVTLK